MNPLYCLDLLEQLVEPVETRQSFSIFNSNRDKLMAKIMVHFWYFMPGVRNDQNMKTVLSQDPTSDGQR